MVGKTLEFFFGDMPAETRNVIWRVLITVFVAIHITWACGWIPGVPGFAMAADVTEVRDDIRDIKRTLLEQQLFEAHLNRCKADDEMTRRFWSERVERLLSAYENLMGRPFRGLPRCNEVGR